MACDADDLLHHGNRSLYSVHLIRQFDRSDSSSMDLLSMAHRHSAFLLRIDTMAQDSLHPCIQALVVKEIFFKYHKEENQIDTKKPSCLHNREQDGMLTNE